MDNKVSKNTKITVFTPAYNRGYLLPRLYESLCQQTDKRFIWLVVDDGSTDNTRELIEGWQRENKLQIEYHHQSNHGKSFAHNIGVNNTQTELFTCVDSDDILSPQCIEKILSNWQCIDIEHLTGILTKRFDLKSKKSMTQIPKGLHKCTLYDAYNKYGLRGDTMLIFRTDVVNKFAFPHFEGEKFVPESYLYDLIDQEGVLLILDFDAYGCEYMDDGYTKNMARLLKSNPRGYIAYITQRIKLMDKSVKMKFLDSIRYVAMIYAYDIKKMYQLSANHLYTTLALLPGALMFYKRYKGI